MKLKFTLIIVTVFAALYVVPLVLILNIFNEKIASIPNILIEGAALFGILGIYFAAHFFMPKIPDIKPLLLLPNTRSIKLWKVLALLFTDISKWYPFLLVMAGLHAAFLFNANYLGGIIVTFTLTFIYAATLLAAWMTGVTIRFARTEKSNYGAYIISLSIVIVILVFFAIANIDDLWIKYSIYLTFSMLLYLTAYFHLRKNVEQLLEMAFEPLNYVTTLKINHKVSASGSVPMFLQKELRMCFRSKRIRLLFFIVPIYAVAVSIGLFLKGNIQGFIFMPYLVTTALAMNYNEYWERYWAWDRQSHGLIFSVPAGKRQYFMQKISCLFLFGATVLPVHILFFWDNVFVGVTGGLLLLSAVSIFTSYDSMSNPNLNADLNDSIWTKVRFNIRFMISLIGMAAANWYLFFRNEVLLWKLLYVLVVVVLIITAVKRLNKSLQLKEWGLLT